MPKLYGELVADNKMKVDLISYSGNKAGGVEVNSVLEGEGQLYVNPETGEQWFEVVDLEDDKEEENPEKETLEQKVDRLLNLLEGGVGDVMGS